jgi:hypothetical protein
MNIGYSTHGYWAPLKELKEIEVEDRGNHWFDDTKIDLESTEGPERRNDEEVVYIFNSGIVEDKGY